MSHPQPQRGPFRLAGVLLTALTLAACGGGTGGGGGSGEADGLAPLTVSNAGDAAATALYAAELALMAAQALADETRALGAERTGSRGVDCGSFIASRATARLVDADASGGPSAGDRIEIDHESCHSPRLDYVVQGRLSLQLTQLQEGGRAALAGVVDFGSAPGGLVLSLRGPASSELLRLQGRMQVQLERSAFANSLRVSAGPGQEVRLVYPASRGGQAYALSAFSVEKATRYDTARGSLQLSGRLQGDSLGGAVQVSTPQPLINYIGHYPEAHAGQGRIDIDGAGRARARLLPGVTVAGATSGSFNVRVELDLGGDGVFDASGTTNWSNVVAGYLWWDELQPLPYDTQVLEAGAGPRLITAFSNADAWPREEALRVQLSQPPGPGAMLVARLLDLGLRAEVGNGGTGSPAEVPIEQQMQGASLWVRPLQPLRPSHRYRLELSNDGNFSPARQVSLPRVGMQPMSVVPAVALATADTLRPVITAPAGTLLVRDGSVRLTAASSRMPAGTRHRWSQVGGPALAFDTQDGAETVVRLLDRSGGVGAAHVRLTITSPAGDSESIERVLRTVGDSLGTWLLYFRSPPGEYVGGGLTEYLGEALGSFTFEPSPASSVLINHWPNGFPNAASAPWSLLLSSGSPAAPLAVGRYTVLPSPPPATGPQVSLMGDGRACAFGSVTGSFEIFELERDAAGVPTRLAADFTQGCSGNGLALIGAVRFNSSRPLPD